MDYHGRRAMDPAPPPATSQPAVPAIRCENLVKRFGTLAAVDGLTLEVPQGAFYAFLGPNGAGKSTTIAMLTGIYGADEGTIHVLGRDLKRDPLGVKASIGVVFEELALFERLTGMQYLVFCGRMYGLKGDEATRRAHELLDLVELTVKADVLVADYSKGMRRKLAIAAALIHAPKLIFLDEPFEGIDVLASAVIRELLKELKRSGTTIFMTTHVLEIAEKLATHAGVIVAGKARASGPVDALRAAHGAATLEELFQTLVGVPKAAGVRLSFYG